MLTLRRWAALLSCLALLSFCVFALADDKSPSPKTIAGFWAGSITIGDQKLRVIVTITTKDDSFSATLDIPDQGAKDIPFDSVEFTDNKLTLNLAKPRASFVGKANKDLTSIEGEWKQNMRSFPLTLTRSEKIAGPNRPQHPKKPYPYREEEVVVPQKKAGIKLAGTLTLPKAKGPFPVVLLITGSGRQDRDETIRGHKPFLVIADDLTRKGIAVLRVDDRGVGGSTGDFSKATTEDFVDDALACVAFLKEHKEIDGKKIGLLGHSEGGAIAPAAATRSKDVAFIVMLAGPGLPGEELLYLQGQAIMKANGASEKVLEIQKKTQQLLFRAALEEKDNEKAKKLIEERFEKLLPELTDDEKQAKILREKMPTEIKAVLNPWMRNFLAYDPRPTLRKVTVPVLALCGEKDVQVVAAQNNAAIRAALKEAGNKDFTVTELPGLNHQFQTSKTGNVNEYAKLEETFSPTALKIIGEWIAERTK
jgi:hypothetical protein